MTKIKNDQKLLIETLQKAGFGYGKIAEVIGIKKSTIASHCRTRDLIQRIGPKIKMSKASINDRKSLQMKRFIECNPLATLADIKCALDLDVSEKTISVHLKKMGLPTRIAKKKIILSDTNRQKRLLFCRDMLEKDDAFIASIWFSDETIVKSRPNGEMVFFRSAEGSEWYEPSNAGGGNSVMFWGVVSLAAYGPLVEVKGKNTAETYIGTLNDYLLPEINAANGLVTFQQDNATIHKTPAVLSFLAENGIQTFEWPPQSPDLSPIENLWNCLKMKMKSLKPRPRTHATMRDACLQIWIELEDSLRVRLIESFRERCRKCIEANGDTIKFICNFWGVKKRVTRNSLQTM